MSIPKPLADSVSYQDNHTIQLGNKIYKSPRGQNLKYESKEGEELTSDDNHTRSQAETNTNTTNVRAIFIVYLLFFRDSTTLKIG